ncbi:unnamed protein product [Bathycoccus prasinos]
MSSSHGTTAAAANVVAVVEGEATTTKAAKENKLKKRETLMDEYEPPFGLRNVDCISVRRLNVLDAFFKDDGDDDDRNNNNNIASQLNSIEVYFTLKRIVKDSSNSIRVCDDSLKTFTSKAISFKKDNKSVCDPDWDIFEKEQRRFREVLERDGIDDDDEEEALVPGLFEFAVYGRRVKEHTSNSSNESSSSHDDEEEGEEEKNRRRRRGKTSIEDKSEENLLHKALISFRHVKRATAQLKQLSQNSRVPVVVLRVKSSRRNGAMTYYARDIQDVKEFENLDVREKLLREEENLHEMYNSSHHVNNNNGKENESHKNEDDISSETTGGGVVITDDILAASKKKGRTNSLDERELVGLVSTMTPKTATASASSPFSSPFRGGPFGSGGERVGDIVKAASPQSKARNANFTYREILEQSVQKLNTENALQSISKVMLASDRREELKQGKLILQFKLEEELRNNRHISQKTQFLFEIEQKRASSEKKADELKRALESGQKQSSRLEKLVSVKTESIRTKRELLMKKRRQLDELRMHLEGPEIDGTLRRTVSALQNRRWQLVRDLAEAFPTKKVGQMSAAIARPWAICGLKLDLADRLLGPTSDSSRKQHQHPDQHQQQMLPQSDKGTTENVKSLVSNNASGGLEDARNRKNVNNADKPAGNQLFQTLATLFGYEDDEDEEFLNASEAESRDGRARGGTRNTNATDYTQFHSSAARDDAEVAAAALGTVCLLVARLSSIFDVPSRYPLAFGSSRSFVGDLKEIKRENESTSDSNRMETSQNNGDDSSSPNLLLGSPQKKKKSSSSSITLTKWRRVEFPLFLDDHAKATGDARRFAYGVFLLNKNVQQILDAYGLESRGPRKTLENVARIFQHAAKLSKENRAN